MCIFCCEFAADFNMREYALAFAFGVLVAPLLPFLFAWFAAKEDE